MEDFSETLFSRTLDMKTVDFRSVIFSNLGPALVLILIIVLLLQYSGFYSFLNGDVVEM